MRYAVVRDGKVCNVILWDGEEDYVAEDDVELHEVPEEVSIGWSYNGTSWTAPEPPHLEPLPGEDPVVVAAKEAAAQELIALGVSRNTARTIAGLPPENDEM